MTSRQQWFGRTGRASVAIAVLGVGIAATPAPGLGQEAATTIYVRSDSDETTVVTPRLRVKAPVGERTSAQVVYSVDVWTSASIDIRTSASLAVTEQRDELDLTLEHELDGLRLTGDYRYSTEPDYESHGGTAGMEIDLANKSATLGVTASAGFDRVGRVGDPGFEEHVRILSGRIAYTQLLDPDTLVQGIYSSPTVTATRPAPIASSASAATTAPATASTSPACRRAIRSCAWPMPPPCAAAVHSRSRCPRARAIACTWTIGP